MLKAEATTRRKGIEMHDIAPPGVLKKNAPLLGLFFSLLFSLALNPSDAAVRSGPAPQQSFQTVAPALIPGTRPEMNSPGYWIGKHPFPDRTILKGDEIAKFNAAIRDELKISYDLATFPKGFQEDDYRRHLPWISPPSRGYGFTSRVVLRSFVLSWRPYGKIWISVESLPKSL